LVNLSLDEEENGVSLEAYKEVLEPVEKEETILRWVRNLHPGTLLAQ
jgi:hypothetical protein